MPSRAYYAVIKRNIEDTHSRCLTVLVTVTEEIPENKLDKYTDGDLDGSGSNSRKQNRMRKFPLRLIKCHEPSTRRDTFQPIRVRGACPGISSFRPERMDSTITVGELMVIISLVTVS